jgi:hypothetical protein
MLQGRGQRRIVAAAKARGSKNVECTGHLSCTRCILPFGSYEEDPFSYFYEKRILSSQHGYMDS